MTNGCPEGAERPLAIVTSSAILIGEQIQFATNSAEVLEGSDALLAEVAKLLAEHPEVLRVRIEGHTDDVGEARYNEELSRRRAAAVARWLASHGVDEQRLESAGFGSARPLASNRTEEGRALNRRVVFTIRLRGRR
jgi:OOP family OmpA-OmpF porin